MIKFEISFFYFLKFQFVDCVHSDRYLTCGMTSIRDNHVAKCDRCILGCRRTTHTHTHCDICPTATRIYTTNAPQQVVTDCLTICLLNIHSLEPVKCKIEDRIL